MKPDEVHFTQGVEPTDEITAWAIPVHRLDDAPHATAEISAAVRLERPTADIIARRVFHLSMDIEGEPLAREIVQSINVVLRRNGVPEIGGDDY